MHLNALCLKKSVISKIFYIDYTAILKLKLSKFFQMFLNDLFPK